MSGSGKKQRYAAAYPPFTRSKRAVVRNNLGTQELFHKKSARQLFDKDFVDNAAVERVVDIAQDVFDDNPEANDQDVAAAVYADDVNMLNRWLTNKTVKPLGSRAATRRRPSGKVSMVNSSYRLGGYKTSRASAAGSGSSGRVAASKRTVSVGARAVYAPTKILSAEIKSCDYSVQACPILPAGQDIGSALATNPLGYQRSAICLNMLDQGTESYKRIGRQVKALKLEMRVTFHPTTIMAVGAAAPYSYSNQNLQNKFRFVIVRVKEGNSGLAAGSVSFQTLFGMQGYDMLDSQGLSVAPAGATQQQLGNVNNQTTSQCFDTLFNTGQDNVVVVLDETIHVGVESVKNTSFLPGLPVNAPGGVLATVLNADTSFTYQAPQPGTSKSFSIPLDFTQMFAQINVAPLVVANNALSITKNALFAFCFSADPSGSADYLPTFGLSASRPYLYKSWEANWRFSYAD